MRFFCLRVGTLLVGAFGFRSGICLRQTLTPRGAFGSLVLLIPWETGMFPSASYALLNLREGFGCYAYELRAGIGSSQDEFRAWQFAWWLLSDHCTIIRE